MAPFKEQSSSARTKTLRFSNPQPRTTPALSHRATLAGKSNSAPTPSSISRRPAPHCRMSKISSAMKPLPKDETLTNKFQTRLEDYCTRIHHDVDKGLADVHAQYTNQVDHLEAQFQEQLKLLERCAEPLAISLADELVSSVSGVQDQNDGFEELEKRMIRFRTITSDRHKNIKRLMDEWTEVQVSIIGLAAELFGPDHVILPACKTSNEQTNVQEMLKQSTTHHEKKEQRFQTLIDDIAELEHESSKLKSETLNTLKEQQKQHRLQHKKNLTNLSNLARSLANPDY